MIPDYAADYAMLQFNFDRYILKLVTTRGESTSQLVDRSLTFEDKHWSPHYWRRHHRMLSDVAGQFGLPHLFLAVSPWEWSFPWPAWVTQAHAAMRCGPADLAGAAAIAMAHAFQQAIKGFLCGKKRCMLDVSLVWQQARACTESGESLLWSI